jgi:hypothetical protein
MTAYQHEEAISRAGPIAADVLRMDTPATESARGDVPSSALRLLAVGGMTRYAALSMLTLTLAIQFNYNGKWGGYATDGVIKRTGRVPMRRRS